MDTMEQPTEAWREAGDAWGHAANDWAFLFEPYARDAIETIFSTVGLGPRTAYLDVACGSGLALGRAERMGADVAGIDASIDLIEIARRRAISGEIVAGDMFDLPWGNATFDVVTSFNGIWGGCDGAVAEMGRTLRDGGYAAITFWGPGDKLDLREYFMLLGSTRQDVAEELMSLASIGTPGHAEEMFEQAGLTVVERGATAARMELPDEDLAWRALRSPGVVVPPLEVLGEDELRRRTLEIIEPFRAADGSYIMQNELTHVIAKKV